MAERPLHLSVLEHLRRQVDERRADHLEKAGKGVEDRDYQRLVGRIAEGKVVTDAIDDLIERLKRNDLEDFEDDE